MTNEFLLNTISIMKHKIQFTKLRCQFYTHHLSTIKTWEKSTPTKIHQLTGKKKAVFSGGGAVDPPGSKLNSFFQTFDLSLFVLNFLTYKSFTHRPDQSYLPPFLYAMTSKGLVLLKKSRWISHQAVQL